MICKRGGFITQRHNDKRDLEADLLSMVCSDVEIEPVLQDISGEQLGRGPNRAPEEIRYPRTRVLGEPTISILRREGLSP